MQPIGEEPLKSSSSGARPTHANNPASSSSSQGDATAGESQQLASDEQTELLIASDQQPASNVFDAASGAPPTDEPPVRSKGKRLTQISPLPRASPVI